MWYFSSLHRSKFTYVTRTGCFLLSWDMNLISRWFLSSVVVSSRFPLRSYPVHLHKLRIILLIHVIILWHLILFSVFTYQLQMRFLFNCFVNPRSIVFSLLFQKRPVAMQWLWVWSKTLELQSIHHDVISCKCRPIQIALQFNYSNGIKLAYFLSLSTTYRISMAFEHWIYQQRHQ